MKKISRSIFASVFFHLFLLGIILFFAERFWEKKFSGGIGKGNSPVWIGLGTQAGKNSTEPNPTPPNPKPQTRSIPSPTPSPKTSNTVSIAPEKSLSTSSQEGTGNENGSAGAAGGGVGGVGSGGSGGGSDIKLEILRKIQRMKHYPALARARNWEGVVEVEFLIAPSGSLEKISVVQSSGFSVLDEEALATVRRAQPLPYYSSVLRVPIHFDLER